MLRPIVALASIALLLATAGTRAALAEGTVAAPPTEAAGATPAPAVQPIAAEPPAYGPIHVTDPALRAQIKRLCAEESRLEEVARTELSELAEQLRTETDADFRWEIQQRIVQVKLDLQLRTMELGLEIARLNGDEQRVSEYELALDQVRHPEKYRPAPVDPAVQHEKMRAHGLEVRDPR